MHTYALEHAVLDSGRCQSGKSRDGVEGRASTKPLEAIEDHTPSYRDCPSRHSLVTGCFQRPKTLGRDKVKISRLVVAKSALVVR